MTLLRSLLGIPLFAVDLLVHLLISPFGFGLLLGGCGLIPHCRVAAFAIVHRGTGMGGGSRINPRFHQRGVGQSRCTSR